MSDKAEPEAAKKPILDRLPPILRPFAIVLFTIIILPVLILIKLIILPFEKPIERSPEEVAKYLRDFMDGVGTDQDWDDFTCIPIKDPDLEEIRQQAADLPLPLEPGGYKLLEESLVQLSRHNKKIGAARNC